MTPSDAGRWLPFLAWWPRVNRQTLRADLIAGLTGGLVLVPQGVAFATIAGMPPEYGLYAAMLPAIVAALWGSSWHLVSGPTTAISLVVFATISPLAVPGTDEYVRLVLLLTLLAGIFQLVLGVLRLGTLVNFVSHTVVVGFTTGAAILIAASQVRNFFGIDIRRGSPPHEAVIELVRQSAQVNWYVVAVAVVTVIASVVIRRFAPRFPHLIAAMVAGGLTAALLNHLFGAPTTRIESIGALQIGLPPLSLPDLSRQSIEQLIPIAIAVSLLALTEAVSIARAVALKSGQRIDGSQEFIGQGLSNIAGAFFSGYASSGSFNRTGLNYAAGAKTPLAAAFSAVFLLAIVVFLAPLAKYLPIPAMAGILFVVAWGLIDFHHIGEIVRASRQETAVLAATFVATLTLDLEFAIYIGVLLSLLLYLNRTSKPGVESMRPVPGRMPPVFEPGIDDTTPSLAIVRVNGSIFFGAVDYLQRAFQTIDDNDPSKRHLLIVASGINFVDLAGAQLLGQEALRRRQVGGDLYIFNMKDEPLGMLRNSGQFDVIGAHNFFALGDDVVSALKMRLSATDPKRPPDAIETPSKPA